VFSDFLCFDAVFPVLFGFMSTHNGHFENKNPTNTALGAVAFTFFAVRRSSTALMYAVKQRERLADALGRWCECSCDVHLCSHYINNHNNNNIIISRSISTASNERTLSYLCHELRNPLHAITATVDSILSDQTPVADLNPKKAVRLLIE
jgi:hypothetical protein